MLARMNRETGRHGRFFLACLYARPVMGMDMTMAMIRADCLKGSDVAPMANA